jgi:glycosyltransferase involved in cell wall biosynthesis
MPERKRMRIVWIAPDDLGGGVVSVAQACCRQATRAGHEATLLLALKPQGSHADEFGGFQLRTLDSQPPHVDIPARLIRWLGENPQDVAIFNSCEQADAAIPYVPQRTRVISVIHDTAERYFDPAIRYEQAQDGVIAVSETVAERFRIRLRDPSRLHVVLNGTVLPDDVSPLPTAERWDDLVFLGGEKPLKGAFDCLDLWQALVKQGFKGRLHWFGELSAGFRGRVESAPHADRIVTYDRRPRRDIFEVAARSKVFLMLSRVEPFGMATIECMGMGCLPVAWDIPTGTKEIVSGSDGFYAPLGDFRRLAAMTQQAVEQHAARYEAAMSTARDRFSEQAMWTRYWQALESITAAPAAVRPMAGHEPGPYQPPFRFFQRLPERVRGPLRALAGRWPRLGFALRDFRGR